MKLKALSTGIWQPLIVGCWLFLLSAAAWAQGPLTVRGTVLDATTHEPMIGVSVIEQGTSNGAITDMDGHFVLQQVRQRATIQFSYVGYLDLTLPVAVGYGTQKRANLSGAVSAVEGDKLAAKPTSDVLSAMQGELPGVAVLRSSGEPGSETSGIRIRGFSSANATSALVLIDGVEGDLSLLNADDIESISVLKDASASAIYGARAASGVVLVTTKSGSGEHSR